METNLQQEIEEEYIAKLPAVPQFKETATDFWQFLKAPQQLEPVQQRPSEVWLPFLQLFLLKVATAFSAGLLLYALFIFLGLNPFVGHKVEEFFRETHFAVAFLLVAILGPAIEEFFFRLPLRFTRGRVFVALIGFCLFCLPYILELLDTSALINIAIVASFLMLAISFLLSESWPDHLQQVWQQRFGAVFYTFSSVFALVHLANFDNLNLPVALIPLLVVPQFVAGLFWGYIRLRFSLGWAILGHGLFNAVVVSLSYLTV